MTYLNVIFLNSLGFLYEQLSKGTQILAGHAYYLKSESSVSSSHTVSNSNLNSYMRNEQCMRILCIWIDLRSLNG